MNKDVASILNSLHERICALEGKYTTAESADFLIRQACHGWIQVQKMTGASELKMELTVKAAVREALKKVDNMLREGLSEAVRDAEMPLFFREIMKTDRSITKSAGMIKTWIFDVLRE
jgi:hypothetical protein